MKKRFNQMISSVLLVTLLFFSSCYTYTAVVGKGPQGKGEESKMNAYLIAGLVPVGVSDAKQMAGGATDYSVTTTHTFVDGLLGGITFGIFTPTHTIVKK